MYDEMLILSTRCFRRIYILRGEHFLTTPGLVGGTLRADIEGETNVHDEGQTSERIGNLLSHFESQVVGLGHAERPGAMAEAANDAQGHGYAEPHDLQQDLLSSPL